MGRWEALILPLLVRRRLGEGGRHLQTPRQAPADPLVLRPRVCPSGHPLAPPRAGPAPQPPAVNLRARGQGPARALPPVDGPGRGYGSRLRQRRVWVLFNRRIPSRRSRVEPAVLLRGHHYGRPLSSLGGVVQHGHGARPCCLVMQVGRGVADPGQSWMQRQAASQEYLARLHRTRRFRPCPRRALAPCAQPHLPLPPYVSISSSSLACTADSISTRPRSNTRFPVGLVITALEATCRFF